RYILPLRPLPPVLQNIYVSNDAANFGHFSHQYNSLFSFTTIGYTGGIVNLHPHAFTVNGCAYHQIHSANTEGYPVNWFVYDADARNNIISQCALNQNIVNRIEQELEAINPFIQGLYQLRNVNYPQARLIIQHPTANTEIAACTIVHSTAIMQERCVQIWRINESKSEYINILNENYEALQYPLFFPYGEIGWRMYWIDIENSRTQKISQIDYYRYHIMTESRFHLLGRLFNEYLVDMFSRADDERLQFIRKKKYRFQKEGQEEDESLEENNETENKIVDEIKDYLNARYLSAMEAVWRIFKYKITSQSFNLLTGQLHLLFCHLILEGVNESLVWIATFLEEHGYNITQCGLPQPHGCLKNITLTLINTTDDLNNIINFIFPTNVLNNPTACLKRAILCPLNVEVNFINDTILQQLEGDETNLYSIDNLADDENINTLESQRYQRNMFTTELLNSFNAPGIPKHCLTLKRGCIATIMRNLSLHDKLCKNSRVIVTNIGHRLITIKHPAINCIVHLPRITFQFCISHFPFKINLYSELIE
ncbi:17915_t:CDS:2, partial [Gigaspora rosea]